MVPSTKPEVHNTSQSSQEENEATRIITCANNLLKLGYVVSEMCDWTNKQTNKQTDKQTGIFITIFRIHPGAKSLNVIAAN